MIVAIFLALIVIGGVAFAFTSGGPPVVDMTSTTTPTTTTTTTSSPPFTDLTDGAVLYEGDYPEITQVTYYNREGVLITDVDAYAGLIVLLAEPGTDPWMVWDTVDALGGELVMELPAAGIYWASVALGSEADFISEMLSEFWVVNAYPLFPVGLAGELTSVNAEQRTGWFWDAYDTRALDSDVVIVDAWSNDASPDIDAGNGEDHGQAVSDLATGCEESEAASKTEVDAYLQPTGTGAGQLNPNAKIPAIMLAAMNATDRGRVTVVNLSLQSNPGIPDGVDRHGDTSPETIAAAELQGRWLEEILQAMETMGPPYLDHVLVNICAGNFGLDLTDQYRGLKARYPNAWAHVINAGGIDTLGDRLPDLNSSEDPDDVIYAEMPEGLYGTSFSAPQFTCLATALAAERPDLKSGDIKRAIVEAAPNIGGFRTKPTLAQVLAKANELFPPSPTTTTTTTTATSTTTTTTTAAPGIERDWSGSHSVTHTEPTDPYTRTSGGYMTWTNIVLNGNSFQGDLWLNGITVLDTNTGEYLWSSEASGTVTGTFSDGTNFSGTLSFSVPGTVSPPREWYFTATLDGASVQGTISGSASGTASGVFGLALQ